MAPALLETRGLGKDYGGTTALAGLDLDVEEGERFGLLGPNGAGKTTAISMIAGVVTPSRGVARIDGRDVRERGLATRRAIGVVPQDLAIYEELSARQNLRFFARLYRLAGAELARQIDWALEVAGLTDRADEVVARFSGGMKRRLNLVVGLIHRPRLVILDEPTVGVDPQSRSFLFAAIRALAAAGTTVIYTSHYMEEVEALCRRVAILDHGGLVAEGRVTDLVARHGGGGLEIAFRGPLTAVLAALAGHGEVAPVGEPDGTAGIAGPGRARRDTLDPPHRARIAGAPGVGPLVRAVEQAGGEVVSIDRHEPSLESVFLALTGHTLRDGA